MTGEIYSRIISAASAGKKRLAVLIDPDKTHSENLSHTISLAERAEVDYFFVGSSFLVHDGFEQCIKTIKQHSKIPVVLFPGGRMQISGTADAILFLSLISGRNPDLLIGEHVKAAPRIQAATLEVIPTGYMLIDGGKLTSVTYISHTIPIPRDKPDIAIATAVAGEMLGLKLIYLETGSGAHKAVSYSMIKAVRKNINVPLIVGGGIKTPEMATEICSSGADMVVVGNLFEKSPELIFEMTYAVHNARVSSQKA